MAKIITTTHPPQHTSWVHTKLPLIVKLQFWNTREYGVFSAIIPRSTLTRSGSTCQSLIYESNRSGKLFVSGRNTFDLLYLLSYISVMGSFIYWLVGWLVGFIVCQLFFGLLNAKLSWTIVAFGYMIQKSTLAFILYNLDHEPDKFIRRLSRK